MLLLWTLGLTVKRFILTKDDPASDTSRIKPGTLDLYVSKDGETYQRLDLSTYQLKMGLEGLAFEPNTPMEVVGIKAHSKFDERAEDGSFTDQATFKNALGDFIKAEQEVSLVSLPRFRGHPRAWNVS